MVVHIVLGAIPNEIGNLQNLEIFLIGFNNFNGSIPFEIFNISTIQAIDMLFNDLSGHLPSNADLFLPNLQYLHLGVNKLSGTIPGSISNASKLTYLDLGDNSFSGSIPEPLGNLRLLKWLGIAGNNLTIESSTPEFNFSSINFSKNTNPSTIALILDVLPYTPILANSTYLGLPILFGNSKKYAFQNIINRVSSKMDG